MTSPLPKLPDNPLGSVGSLPENPLGAPPRAPLVGSREPLHFPRGGRLRRRGRSTKAPLPSLSRSQGQQGAAKPQVVQVINQPAKPAPAPAQPAPAPRAGRPRVAEERAATRTYLGERLGGSVNKLPREGRERLRTLLRDHGREYHREYHAAGAERLKTRLAERQEQRAQEAALAQRVAQRQAAQMRQAAQVERTDLGAETPPPPQEGGQP